MSLEFSNSNAIRIFFFIHYTTLERGERGTNERRCLFIYLFYVMWVGFLFYFIFILIVTVGNFFFIRIVWVAFLSLLLFFFG